MSDFAAKVLAAQQLAARAITEALSPLVDGEAIIGLECVVTVHVDGYTAGTKINIGPTPKHKAAAHEMALAIYCGALGSPTLQEEVAISHPAKH